MKSTSFLFFRHKIIGKTLIASVGSFILIVIYTEINSTLGFMQLTENANSTLNALETNLTSSMVSLALTQINDSRSTGLEEGLSNLTMAERTIKHLIDLLSDGRDYSSFNRAEEICLENRIIDDCIIGDLTFALDSLYHKDLAVAEQVLKGILENV